MKSKNYIEKEYPNGIKLIRSYKQNSNVCSIRIFVKVGSRNELNSQLIAPILTQEQYLKLNK